MSCIEQALLQPFQPMEVTSLAQGCDVTQKRSCTVTVGTGGCDVSGVLLSHRAQGKRLNVLNYSHEWKIRLSKKKKKIFSCFQGLSKSLRMKDFNRNLMVKMGHWM